MKQTLANICFLVATTFVFSQKTVDAVAILKDIKAGKSISYENTTIKGVLDFTFMNEALEKLPKKKKNSWWNSSKTNNVIDKQIKVKISFTNCNFIDDVLAYIPHEESGYTFVANFEQEVIFKDCIFEKKALFKYSHFDDDLDFSGTIFTDDNTFKYAKFNRKSNFTATKFNEVASFKYAKFKKNTSFSNAVFKDSAIFKYAYFSNGVSFRNTQFEEDLNIKYTKVSGDFDITNMHVKFDIDSKYASINGKSFDTYLLRLK